MNPTFTPPGWPQAAPGTEQVPERYFGVWSRTFQQTPDTTDTTTLVRWMQLGLWHADVRVPPNADEPLQGFSGTTRITQVDGKEMCTWQRLVDYQPPRATVDEGWIEFETPDKLIETGIHSTYYEVWERLPGSTGRRIALAEQTRPDSTAGACLFISGDYMMRVRPTTPISPAFELTFGKFSGGLFSIEASTIAALKGTSCAISIAKLNESVAKVVIDSVPTEWAILEWAI